MPGTSRSHHPRSMQSPRGRIWSKKYESFLGVRSRSVSLLCSKTYYHQISRNLLAAGYGFTAVIALKFDERLDSTAVERLPFQSAIIILHTKWRFLDGMKFYGKPTYHLVNKYSWDQRKQIASCCNPGYIGIARGLATARPDYTGRK